MIYLRIDPREPQQVLSATLSGQTYQCTFRWRSRVSAWFMDLADAAGNAIVLGRRVSSGGFPLAGCVATARPPGAIVVVDSDGANVDPGETDLGARVQVVYMTPDELATLGVPT